MSHIVKRQREQRGYTPRTREEVEYHRLIGGPLETIYVEVPEAKIGETIYHGEFRPKPNDPGFYWQGKTYPVYEPTGNVTSSINGEVKKF